MSSNESIQADANKILMATYGWPEEIQEHPDNVLNPNVDVPEPDQEPEQETGNLCALFYDQHSYWVCGKPVPVVQ